MDRRLGDMTVERIGAVLKKRGIFADAWPTPFLDELDSLE
jgi:hypothetical protein